MGFHSRSPLLFFLLALFSQFPIFRSLPMDFRCGTSLAQRDTSGETAEM
jgi:hypothetical protein